MLCAAFSCDNVGFHMGADVVTIDYNAPITWEQALEVERRANAYIWADHPIRIWYPSPEELAADPEVRKRYLGKHFELRRSPTIDRLRQQGAEAQRSVSETDAEATHE